MLLLRSNFLKFPISLRGKAQIFPMGLTTSDLSDLIGYYRHPPLFESLLYATSLLRKSYISTCF